MGEGELTCAWLTTVMWNLFIDSTRKADHRFPHQNVDNMQLAAPLPEPDPIWARVTRQHLETALAQLPDEFRIPYELFELKGLSQREIAVQLGLQVDTVASRVRRARQRLKGLLQELVGGDDDR